MSATVPHTELIQLARELARRELAPRALELDAAADATVDAVWGQLADLGLDRALLAEEHGGAGLGPDDLLDVVEELAGGDAGIAMLVLLSNAAHVALAEPLPHAGGRWVLVPVPAAAAVEVEDNGALQGAVGMALGAHGAGGVVIALGGERPLTAVLPTGTPGLALNRDQTQMGLRAATAATVAMSGAEPAARGGVTEHARALALTRAGCAAVAHGISRRARDLALEYACSRRQGGVAIVEHEAIRAMLVAMEVRLAAPRPVLASALAAKIMAGDAAVATTTDAVQVLGGTGYMQDSGVEKLMRDAMYCQLFPEPSWATHAELLRHGEALS